jgi:hypothetical protein
MKSIVTKVKPAATTPRGYWPAWLLSAVALGLAVVPGAGSWAALLFALATAHWAWLAYGGVGGRTNGARHDSENLLDLIVESGRTAGNDLRALRADLKLVRGLVHDVAVTLGDGFQGISERLRAENQVIAVLMARMLDESTALNRHMSEELARASAASAGVNGSLDMLVRSLQFEDVVRQLLEYCDRRTGGIETYIDGLAGLLADPPPGQRPQQQLANVRQACERYLENSTHWASERQRHVAQTSMQSGKVELF